MLLFCAHGSFWTLQRGALPRAEGAPVADGSGLGLRSGEAKLPATSAGSRHARDAPLDRGRSHSRLTELGLLWEGEHGFHPTGASDGPTGRCSARTPHLGDFSAVPTAAGPSGRVARVLPFGASSPLPAPGARAATRTRWPTAGATLWATDASHGSGKNQPTLDGG